MSNADEIAHIFVGSDRSQLLAVKVLEHSIRRLTDLQIRVRSMHDIDLPDPQDPRQGKRTGFSFTRFAIPKLMGYEGRAVYLDADMLVLRDFRELWCLPFSGGKITIQQSVPPTRQTLVDARVTKQRMKQCSVMLMDCSALQWDAEEIIAGLDGKYTYEELLYHMCVLREDEINYGLPFEWNSLELYEPGKTGLIHYTDMHTQPWVYIDNKNAWLWMEEVRLMLEDGSMKWSEIEQEVELGFFRPSLLAQIKDIGQGPARPPRDEELHRYRKMDGAANYQPHRAAREAAQRRKQAIAEYEARIGLKPGSSSPPGPSLMSRVAGKLRRMLAS